MTLLARSSEETSFFRDPRPFDELRRSILPDLIDRRGPTRRLRIWSAGCSSGQEPYSLALLLRDHFPTLKSWNLTILASDLSTDRLDQARQGRYRQVEVNRGLPATHLIQSFHRDGLAWSIDESVRRSIDFRLIDLADSWQFSTDFDLIALRNVLPQLDSETRSATLSRMARTLAPDGYLWLGATETLSDHEAPFERVEPERGSFYQLRRSGHKFLDKT